ncbi:MAG: FRG domain-containing protein [FCB group bacterium]|nr:FRG domain-containing protein [FCB group bacterium]MBL7027400.1 FRG domain-containing protein [Candidatus Neomarinimicrobiota bacterium]MBL7122649.1 FRG domain-containing protein [Candidatus Neomarinimicrobiota bacterium]
MIKEHKVKNFNDYLEKINELMLGVTLWFRGVSHPAYNLLPRIIWKNKYHLENNYVNSFLRNYVLYTSASYSNPWDLYSLMQHYGLYTRLLDWTESPLYALFFALTTDQNKNQDRVVWAMPPFELNEVTIGFPTVYTPGTLHNRNVSSENIKVDHIDSYLPTSVSPLDSGILPEEPMAIYSTLNNPRIRGQKGCFTIHGEFDTPLEEYANELRAPFFFHKIILKGSENMSSYITPLFNLGINEEHIYQDLDSMVKRIIRENESS